jgi:methyltransferase family protein
VIARLLHAGGHLALTTSLVDDDTDFETWWYARDETHVSFYRPETMACIGARFGWELLELSQGVALFVSR